MGPKHLIYLSLLLAHWWRTTLGFEFCDIYEGPVQTWCSNTTREWISCLSKSYIERLFHGHRICVTKYCTLTCMTVKHGKPSLYTGPIYEDCSCQPEEDPVTTVLPKWCQSPDGRNCKWYTNCLERAHSCIASNNEELSVEYAKHLCDLYESSKHYFSVKTRQWIDSVRRCLLVKLVPIIRPYYNISNCQDIESFAADTQLQCHLAPYRLEPSVCDLDLEDWTKVFWTIKGNQSKSTSDGLKNMLESTSKCEDNMLQRILGDKSTRIVQNIQQTGMFLVRLTVTGDHGNDNVTEFKEYDEIVESISGQLAIQLSWSQNSLLWFAFVSNRSTVNEIDVNILLGSRSLYDVTAISFKNSQLIEILIDMVIALRDEKISLNIDDRFNVTAFSACLDFGCQVTAYDIAPKLKAVVNVVDFPAVLSNIPLICLCCSLSKFL